MSAQAPGAERLALRLAERVGKRRATTSETFLVRTTAGEPAVVLVNFPERADHAPEATPEGATR